MDKEKQLLKLSNIDWFVAEGLENFPIAEWDIHNSYNGGHLIPLWSLDPNTQQEVANEIHDECFEQFQAFMSDVNSWYNYYVEDNQEAVDAQNALIKKLGLTNLKGILEG